MRYCLQREEKLRRVAISTIVRHTHQPFPGMLKEDFVLELSPHITMLAVWRIYGFTFDLKFSVNGGAKGVREVQRDQAAPRRSKLN